MKTYEWLANEVRNTTSIKDLWKLVGPSEEEETDAQKRLERMCEIWDNHDDELMVLHQLLMFEQVEFESKYC